MAVNVKYQYRFIPIEMGDDFFTAYLSRWMGARIPLVKDRMKRSIRSMPLEDLLKIKSTYAGYNTDLVGREVELAKTGAQSAARAGTDVANVQVANIRARGQVAVEEIRRASAIEQIDRDEAYRFAASRAVTEQDRQAINTAVSGILAQTNINIDKATTPQAKAEAYRAGVALAAQAVGTLVNGTNPLHNESLKTAVRDQFRTGVQYNNLDPGTKDAFKRAEDLGYWSQENIQSQPEDELWAAAGTTDTFRNAAGLAPAPAPGGFSAQPLPGLSAPTTVAGAPGTAPAAAPAVAPGAPPAPPPAPATATGPVSAAPAPATTTGSVAPAGAAPVATPGVAPVVAPPGSTSVSAPVTQAGSPQVYRNAAGGEVPSYAQTVTSGVPIVTEQIARNQMDMAQLDEELARRVREGKLATGGRATLDLREPRPNRKQGAADFVASRSEGQLTKMQQELQALIDASPGAKGREAKGARQDAAISDVRDTAYRGTTELPADAGVAADVLGARSKTKGQGSALETPVDPPTKPTPDWVDKGKQDAERAKLAAQRDAGQITQEQYEAGVRAVAEMPPEDPDAELAARLSAGLGKSIPDAALAEQVASVVAASGGDYHKVSSIVSSMPTGTAQEKAIRRELEVWLDDNAGARTMEQTLSPKAAAATVKAGQDYRADVEAKKRRDEERAKAEAATPPGAYADLRDRFVADNVARVDARNERDERDASSPRRPTPAYTAPVINEDEEFRAWFDTVGEEKGGPAQDETPVTKGPTPVVINPAPANKTKAADPDTRAFEDRARARGLSEADVQELTAAYRAKRTAKAATEMGI